MEEHGNTLHPQDHGIQLNRPRLQDADAHNRSFDQEGSGRSNPQ